MRLALVALLCAATATAEPLDPIDGGTVLDIDVGELVLADGSQMGVVGGCYLDDPKCLTVARELVSLRAENIALKSSAVPAPLWVLALIGGALLVGATGGALAVTLIRR